MSIDWPIISQTLCENLNKIGIATLMIGEREVLAEYNGRTCRIRLSNIPQAITGPTCPLFHFCSTNHEDVLRAVGRVAGHFRLPVTAATIRLIHAGSNHSVGRDPFANTMHINGFRFSIDEGEKVLAELRNSGSQYEL